MLDRLAANAILVFHLGFIAFAIFGGWLVLWRPRCAWLHLPAWSWGIWIELSHGICPLTPLENHFRHQAGQAGYSGGFIEHYLVPVIYPPGLEPVDQLALAAVLLVMNLALYAAAIRRWRRRARP
ncbi:MAG TPA: DUF2784 domain-containing protein [Nevskia sp.]|jgi:hypothetical protein|nr:DUF2784 domain-containing protein [Nevskia sp.]